MKDDTKRRVTVDLEPDEHRALKQYALDHDATISDVLRSLLSVLSESRPIAEDVAKRIAGQGSEKAGP